MIEILFLIRWFCVMSFILAFIFYLYSWYRYCTKNKLVIDIWNFFAQINQLNSVLNEVIFKGKNSHQYEAKRVKIMFWLMPILLCLTIWSIAYLGTLLA